MHFDNLLMCFKCIILIKKATITVILCIMIAHCNKSLHLIFHRNAQMNFLDPYRVAK